MLLHQKLQSSLVVSNFLSHVRVGRHFGIDGLLNSWWTEKSEQNYEKAKRCYIEQYNKLEVRASDTNETFYVSFIFNIIIHICALYTQSDPLY